MEQEVIFRKANAEDLSDIWPVFEQGIEKRRLEGSTQWQDGYPNAASVASDIAAGNGFVCIDREQHIVGYVALIFEGDPAYDYIENGAWLTSGKYAVIHRLVVSQERKIKGLASWMMECAEGIAKDAGIPAMRADTNFDNEGMLRVFAKCGYQYCGVVYMRGGARQAFEKLLLS